MPTAVKDMINRIDEMMEKAVPEDGSAPLPPVLDLGNYIVQVWPSMRRALKKASCPRS